MRFVLDHISKPEIRNRGFDEWAVLIRRFRSQRNHVWCKLSGMVTEADWKSWTPQDLKPYVHEVLDVFGTDRCMFGTDWPVCLVAARLRPGGRCPSGMHQGSLRGRAKEDLRPERHRGVSPAAILGAERMTGNPTRKSINFASRLGFGASGIGTLYRDVERDPGGGGSRKGI